LHKSVTYTFAQRPALLDKELHISTKKPHISAKEPYFKFTQELYRHIWKEIYIFEKETYLSA